jgi:hypothetical protein
MGVNHMSSISSVNSSAAQIYQMQQAAAVKQGGHTAAANTNQQTQVASSDPDHDGDTDGAGGIDTRA